MKPTLRLATVVAAAALLPAAVASAGPPPPDVPGDIAPPAGEKVFDVGHAVGVQIYSCNGSSWALVAPRADLYADNGQLVITHYAGPTWESRDGSRVVGRRVNGIQPDTSAIPWLLLAAKSNTGPGAFSRVQVIQRVNTVGGIAPTAPGSVVGEEARVPYTADYYFYRAP